MLAILLLKSDVKINSFTRQAKIVYMIVIYSLSSWLLSFEIKFIRIPVSCLLQCYNFSNIMIKLPFHRAALVLLVSCDMP